MRGIDPVLTSGVRRAMMPPAQTYMLTFSSTSHEREMSMKKIKSIARVNRMLCSTAAIAIRSRQILLLAAGYRWSATEGSKNGVPGANHIHYL